MPPPPRRAAQNAPRWARVPSSGTCVGTLPSSMAVPGDAAWPAAESGQLPRLGVPTRLSTTANSRDLFCGEEKGAREKSGEEDWLSGPEEMQTWLRGRKEEVGPGWGVQAGSEEGVT